MHKSCFGADAVMKRKIYNKLSEWKNTSNGDTAILIDGARRVGNQYILKNILF